MLPSTSNRAAAYYPHAYRSYLCSSPIQGAHRRPKEMPPPAIATSHRPSRSIFIAKICHCLRCCRSFPPHCNRRHHSSPTRDVIVDHHYSLTLVPYPLDSIATTHAHHPSFPSSPAHLRSSPPHSHPYLSQAITSKATLNLHCYFSPSSHHLPHCNHQLLLSSVETSPI